jgi:hypothetical protein
MELNAWNGGTTLEVILGFAGLRQAKDLDTLVQMVLEASELLWSALRSGLGVSTEASLPLQEPRVTLSHLLFLAFGQLALIFSATAVPARLAIHSVLRQSLALVWPRQLRKFQKQADLDVRQEPAVASFATVARSTDLATVQGHTVSSSCLLGPYEPSHLLSSAHHFSAVVAFFG